MSDSKEPILQIPTKEVAPAPRRPSRSWCSERFLELFSDTDYATYLPDSAEYSRRHKVLDFLVTPGKASAKIQDVNNKLSKIEICITEYADDFWLGLFEEFVKQAYFVAKLLAGELPIETEQVFSSAGLPLFPPSLDRMKILYDGEEIDYVNKHVAAVVYRLAQRLDEDPFAIFLLRGCGREELISNIRRLRRQLRAPMEKPANLPEPAEKPAPQPLFTAFNKNFWSAGKELQSLEFNIKADELPAAILKWLDPLPLSGAEDKVEFLLEEAYAQITRRAHAFGLGL